MFKIGSKSISLVQNIKSLINSYVKERFRYRFVLKDVQLDSNSNVKLKILIDGIKKEVVEYTPEDIVFNDNLLTEFSPCDVRAITFLSFQKLLNFNETPYFKIVGQLIESGRTVFKFLANPSNEIRAVSASKAYEDYDLLNNLSRKDMINVIATAVQEQSIKIFEDSSPELGVLLQN